MGEVKVKTKRIQNGGVLRVVPSLSLTAVAGTA
jgi:hypothetical protein